MQRVTKVGSSKCLRYDVLFSRWSPGRAPSGHAWRQELAALQAQDGTTAGDMLKKMLSFIKLIEMPGTKYGTTYSRYNWESQKRELLGYGGQNESMWTECNQYFTRTMVPNSIFGKPLLHLKTVCWFNPWVTVENIPSAWRRIAIDVHHVNLPGCSLRDVELQVKMLPMSAINDAEAQWNMLEKRTYSGSTQRKSNQYLTEPLTNVSLPENAEVGTHYAITVQFSGCNGTWKGSWQFDGITIKQA